MDRAAGSMSLWLTGEDQGGQHSDERSALWIGNHGTSTPNTLTSWLPLVCLALARTARPCPVCRLHPSQRRC